MYVYDMSVHYTHFLICGELFKFVQVSTLSGHLSGRKCTNVLTLTNTIATSEMSSVRESVTFEASMTREVEKYGTLIAAISLLILQNDG